MRLLIVLFFCSFFCNAQLGGDSVVKTLYVKDFGAKPNDSKDDTTAFQNCIDEALKYPDACIIINSGTYNISQQLSIDFIKQSLTIKGEVVNGVAPKIFSTSARNILRVRGFFSNPSKSSFSLSKLSIQGNNAPFSSNHSKAEKDNWYAAVIITDMNEAYIDNVEINKFYGQGIHITTTDPVNLPMGARFSNVEIVNCKLIDIWGNNYKKDDYGDAIYLANVAKGVIRNNYIENNLLRTKQLGRSGITLEYFAENIEVSGNKIIEGYDRPLHIEATLGGHKISNNLFQGSDLGIVIAENIDNRYQFVDISGNIISNVNLRKNVKVLKSYNEGSFGDRSLAYVVTSGNRLGNLISFNNNKFIIDNTFIYNSNSVFNIRSKNIQLLGNSFTSTDKNLKFSIYNYGKSIIKSNKLAPNFSVQ